MNFCDLREKKIIVTGASSGMGREICILLSRLNACVYLTGRSEEGLKKTLGKMQGSQHLSVAFDLCDFERYKEIFEKIVSGIGQLDGLVHFAGVRKTLPLKTTKLQSIREMFDVHLFAFFELIKFFSKKSIVKDDGGAVVVASSVLSIRGAPAVSAYGASKSAIDGAVRSLACELASKKIRVNSVAPGHVETEMNEAVQKSLPKEAFDQILKNHPLGIGRPVDVANLVAFLLSEEARWITGTTICIDGGFTARS